jgi:hypothetical protein
VSDPDEVVEAVSAQRGYSRDSKNSGGLDVTEALDGSGAAAGARHQHIESLCTAWEVWSVLDQHVVHDAKDLLVVR